MDTRTNGRERTKEDIEKSSQSMKLAYKEGRMKVSEIGRQKTIARNKSPAMREATRKRMTGRKMTDKQRELYSIMMREKWKNPDYREKARQSHLGKKQSEETIEKRRLKLSGENNWRWKGGITPLVRKIRNCWSMQKWKKECRKSGDRCVICESKKELHVDHITAFSEIMERNNIKTYEQALECTELWDIKNGRLLCKQCHLKTENYGNRKKTK